MAYYFKLPSYNDLRSNPMQLRAVGEEESIALTGGPGTGKSVVCVWRHMNNYERSRRASILLTYTKSLHHYLQQCVQSHANKQLDDKKKYRINKAAREVGLANSWTCIPYDEIIIDEAQDLPEEEQVLLIQKNRRWDQIRKPVSFFGKDIKNLTHGSNYKLNDLEYVVSRWSKGNLNYIKKGAPMISYGADDKQILYPERATNQKRLKEIFGGKERLLNINYRNTFHILNFAKHLLGYNVDTSTLERLKDKNKGTIPQLSITKNKENQNFAMLDIIEQFNDGVTNIAILLFFKNQFANISGFLNKNGVEFSEYKSDDDNFSQIHNVHLTTFKSAKGLEFDVVIIPEFDSYKRLMDNPHYNLTSKDYYVALTRARRNLILISNDELSCISDNVVNRVVFAETLRTNNDSVIHNPHVVNENIPDYENMPDYNDMPLPIMPPEYERLIY